MEYPCPPGRELALDPIQRRNGSRAAGVRGPVGLPVRDLLLKLKTDRLNHSGMTCRVGDPPLQLISHPVQYGRRPTAPERGARHNLVRAHQPIPAHGADGLQRPKRISKVEEEASTDHHVELTQIRGVEVVHTHLDSADRGSQQPAGDLETDALLLARGGAQVLHALRSDPWRPIPELVVRDVSGHHFAGSPALELEGELSVICADIETAFAGDVRPREFPEHGSEIEPAGGTDPGCHVHRVVPEWVGRDDGPGISLRTARVQCILQRCRASYQGMRVLTIGNMYPPHHLGGYELTWRSSVAHLRSAGHSVRVVTTDYENPDADPAATEDLDVHRELRWYWRGHEWPRFSPVARWRIERHNAHVLNGHLADFRPDVVAWWAMGGMSLGLIEQVRRRGLPAVGVVGDDWMAYGSTVDAWQRAFGSRPAIGRVVERITGLPTQVDRSTITWLFNSDATAERGRQAGQDLLRTSVAHPGIDTHLFRRSSPNEWSWQLLYVGRIDERKGIDLAVKSLTELPAQATLTVLGSGDDRVHNDLRALATTLGLEERVRFAVEPRDYLPRAYESSDVVLFPVQWDEPWGIVPLEAMAVGRPVVATGTGGSREYLRHEVNALVLGREATAKDFARAVARLAEDGDLRATLRDGGFSTAAGFTEESYNAAIEESLLMVLQGEDADVPEDDAARV